MKKIGFLSFGHWTFALRSQARSASDVLLQSIDLAVATEQLGADGAFFRVTSPGNLHRRSRCWQSSARRPAASKSALR
jgi:hypothetical protein